MKIEPSADIRSWALICRQFYEAAIELGFTDEQAFNLTQSVLVAALENQP